MHIEQFSKGIFGALIAVFSFLYGCISEMIIVLAILIMFDWITGVLVAKRDGTFNSKKGFWGAVRKLSYLMVIVTGYLSDITINAFTEMIGLDFNTYGALGFAVVFYLIGNEGISLFQNWIKLNLPVPDFLFRIFTNFKILSNTMFKKNNLNPTSLEDNSDEDTKETKH